MKNTKKMPLIKEKSQLCGVLWEPPHFTGAACLGLTYTEEEEAGGGTKDVRWEGQGRNQQALSSDSDAIVKSGVLVKHAGWMPTSRDSHPETWSGAPQPTGLTSWPRRRF